MSELDTLSLTELKEQAKILGLTFPSNIGASTLRTKIQAALDGVASGADSEEARDEVAAIVAKEAKRPPSKQNWITIMIAEDEQDRQPAFVGVNGKSYRIRRGEPVQVPPEVVEVLQHAKQAITNPRTGDIKYVPTYPWSFA